MMFTYPVSSNPYIIPSKFMPTLYVFGNTRYAARQLKENYRSNYNLAQGYLNNIIAAIKLDNLINNVSIDGKNVTLTTNLENGYFSDASSNVYHIGTFDSILDAALNDTSKKTQVATWLSELKKCVGKLNKMDSGMTVTFESSKLPKSITVGSDGKIEKEEHPYYTVKTNGNSYKLHVLSLRNKLL